MEQFISPDTRAQWVREKGLTVFALFSTEHEATELDLFVAARRWARTYGLPRFVYVKTALETKPVFVDLESPVYVRLFARLVRAAKAHVSGEVPVTVSEMLPTPDQLWLPGPNGETYTSELRIIAVDRRSSHPARSTATSRTSHV